MVVVKEAATSGTDTCKGWTASGTWRKARVGDIRDTNQATWVGADRGTQSLGRCWSRTPCSKPHCCSKHLSFLPCDCCILLKSISLLKTIHVCVSNAKDGPYNLFAPKNILLVSVRCGNIYVSCDCFLKASFLEIGGASLCNSLVVILEVVTDKNELPALLLNNLWLSECAVIALLKNERAPVILPWRCQNWKSHCTFSVFQHSFYFSFLTMINHQCSPWWVQDTQLRNALHFLMTATP